MIRKSQLEDCINLAALSVKVWLETYAKPGIRQEYSQYALSTFTPDYFAGLLQSDEHCLYVDVENDILRGYVLVNFNSHFESAANGFEVDKLYVDSPYRGQGVATQLLEAVKHQLGTPFWLYTWVENEANHFYQNKGFEEIGQLSFSFAHWQIENTVWRYPPKASG